MIRFTVGAVVTATTLAAPQAIGEHAQAQADPPAPPNVIMIMTDDMRVDDLVALPKTEQLLGVPGNGADYTHAYVSLPLCCPSRATFLTGRYAHNHGVWDNDGTNGGFNAFDDSNTLPIWLQNAGYQTVMLGKYLNRYGYPGSRGGPTYEPPGWTSWSALTGPSVWNYRNFNVNVNGTVQEVRNNYQTTDFTRRAVQEIRSRVASSDPMFMWLSLVAPHNANGGPHVPAEPKYAGTSNVGAPKSAAFNEADVTDKPSWIQKLPRLSRNDQQQVIRLRRQRRDALRSVDDTVEKVVNELRTDGELDNTVIMFTTDNGFLLGEHRVHHDKRYPYEESVQVPLLIRGPGIDPGVHTEPVSNVDLAPTIADLAGVTPGLNVDGMSMLDSIPNDRPLLLESPKPWADAGMPAYAGVRQGRWRYIDYGQSSELYDLEGDPWQLRNRISDPSLNQTKADLAAALNGLRDCAGQQCRQ
jgi:N-acetylglucosamine-6-sulfatase